jgi:hypothetical protein
MTTFILKLIDSILSTFKTILMIKDKGIYSSIVNGIATFSYMLIIVDLKTSLQAGLASAIGSYFSYYMDKKYSKDKVWIFDVIPDSKTSGKDFADNIRDNNIPVMTYVGFNEEKDKIVCSKIYSHSKEQSRLIENFISNDFKYSVNEIKSYVS